MRLTWLDGAVICVVDVLDPDHENQMTCTLYHFNQGYVFGKIAECLTTNYNNEVA